MVRDRTIDDDKRIFLIKKCSVYNMSMQKFASCGFDDDKVSLIFVNNDQYEKYNETQILKLQKTI